MERARHPSRDEHRYVLTCRGALFDETVWGLSIAGQMCRERAAGEEDVAGDVDAKTSLQMEVKERLSADYFSGI
jgi:hypothetical protein